MGHSCCKLSVIETVQAEARKTLDKDTIKKDASII